jgi:hypothetical protein
LVIIREIVVTSFLVKSLATGLKDYSSIASSMGRDRLFAIISNPSLKPTQPFTKYTLKPLSSEIKQPERKADQSPACSTEVKTEWSV